MPFIWTTFVTKSFVQNIGQLTETVESMEKIIIKEHEPLGFIYITREYVPQSG